MRWAICYYSGMGNTRLACEYVAARLDRSVALIDITASGDVDLSAYDVVGLATFTDFGGMPRLFESFVESLPDQGGRRAFCLNTYGLASSRTRPDMVAAARDAGFRVFASHSLRMPESYPPMLAIRMGFANQPGGSAMRGLDRFIDSLESELDAQPVVRVPFVGALMPVRPRTTARDDMGPKSVDESLCTRCGRCERDCPYDAIRLGPLPAFDQDRCFGCWRCYNACPSHAIYTKRFRGGPYYPRPSEHARATLDRKKR